MDFNMEISGSKIVLPLPTIEPGKSLLEQLQPGQILRGTALSENINGTIRLQIGVTRLIAQTTLRVPTGQTLTLQVEKTGNLPELRVLTLPSLEQMKSAALKQVMPRQQPLPQLFKHLTQVTADSTRTNQLPPAVKQAVQSILTRVMPIQDPGFKTQLVQAMQLSGTQTEARLINHQINGRDLKLNLLRLIGLIKPLIGNPGSQINQALTFQQPLINPAQSPPVTPPPTAQETNPTTRLLLDLFKHLDGAIARIQTNQLSSLPTEDTTRQVWQFELPIRQEGGFDLFHFRISRDAVRKGTETEFMWSLTLHMNLPSLGPMRVRLSLFGEKLSTTIWSEKPGTASLVNQHLGRLRASLESTGLEVNKLDAFQGIAEIENELPSEQALLNEKV
ncbi:MAG: flagellar hook-length control protein FliK [gamma proteobacterium symbiont of Ctena orbiculata]|uniref:Flagellar hook-length control protein FliK n=2 Tax=Candidatus Thiodiazotropha endolucinida TaxID=1655433 RepID=A0A7Z1AEK6_9GAMM|nr:flagellar hook-length control protein FliK [Candidatus Thiodiazotropha endolucinida]